MTFTRCSLVFSTLLLMLAATFLVAQPPRDRGPGGRMGPMNREDLELVDEFDENDDGWLNRDERTAARGAAEQRREQRGRRGPGGRQRGPGRQPGSEQPAKPGRKISPDDVEHFPSAELYDTTILRTVFLEFESDEWEPELEAFKDTDVEVPATVTVDGKVYPNVGVHFRGASSYGMVPRGKKRSLNLSFDFLDEEQRLYGYKTLNLLNSSGDASMMSTVLYSHIARQYIPAPRANFVQVVINGESWGVYVNVQQFDKIFLQENFDPAKGTRWKVPGSPNGDGGLRYLGDDLAGYKQRFDMKSNDDESAWDALVELCRVLNETPQEERKYQLAKLLNIDEALKFLALDVALVNSDGYWTRASDYSIFRNEAGLFHLIPHDMNEALRTSRGGPPGRNRRGRNREQFQGDRRGGLPRGDNPRGGPAQAGPPPNQFPPPAGRPPRDFGARDLGNRDQARRDQMPPEGFGPPPGRGPGGARGMRHGGVDLDPLIGLEEQRMPLRSQLLTIPELREQYLSDMRSIAQDALDWSKLGPFVASQRKLIAKAVRQDTKKLASYAEFETAVQSLRDFANQRREFLLKYRVSGQVSTQVSADRGK